MRAPITACLLALFLLSSALPSAKAGEGAAERLLLGFEEDEIERLAKTLKATRTAGKTKQGVPVVNLGMKPYAGFAKWALYKGNASEGDYAAGIGGTRDRLYLDAYKGLPADSLLQQSVAYYGIFQDNWAASAGSVFHTCGAFRRIFPMDWSAFDLFRFDVYCHETTQTIRVVLEDEEIGPPVVRNVTVPPDQWTTLEVDLRAAAKARGLDLTRMATLAVTVAKMKGKPKTQRAHPALFDNLRLSRKGTPAKLPIVRDASPHVLPECFRASTTPQPEKMPPGKPDRSPVKVAKPFLIETEKACAVTPVGWVAAYDNNRLMVGFSQGGPNAYAVQSLDGGKTWRGLDGGKKPTLIPIRETSHQCGRGDVVGSRADALVLTNLGCNGPALPSLRLFAQKLTFTGQGWALRPMPALVDADLRHCNSNQSIVRTRDGRLWAAYGLVGRLGTLCINVRYSDDDGVTWRPSREGTSGVLPGSIHSDKGGVGFGYTFEEPRLVPFGSGVACIWQERHGYDYDALNWAHFDGKVWSPIETIQRPKRTAYNATRPPVHAVSVGGKEIFLVSSRFDGVLRYSDGDWKPEPVEIPAGSRISVAGDRTVVVVGAVSEKAKLRESSGLIQKNAPVVLRYWQRRSDGTWSGPHELAREDTPLAASGGRYYAQPGFVVQPYAPPNFVPVAWSCGRAWLKFLRVPVDG